METITEIDNWLKFQRETNCVMINPSKFIHNKTGTPKIPVIITKERAKSRGPRFFCEMVSSRNEREITAMKSMIIQTKSAQ